MKFYNVYQTYKATKKGNIPKRLLWIFETVGQAEGFVSYIQENGHPDFNHNNDNLKIMEITSHKDDTTI